MAQHPNREEIASGDDASSKKELSSWWRSFKRGKKEDPKPTAPINTGIFGVPLQTSIRYANVAISLFDADGRSFIYGYVPIVVAKCGVFLKERATETEGIFRLAGAERRMKELQVTFNSPDRYGKGLDWTGYTVHDAANILRRYLNQLPEPIIPLSFYDRFRQPIRGHQSQAVGEEALQEPNEGEFDADDAIKVYQQLITELPPLNRQLLLYILDLLAVFASKSDLNRMTAPNLSAIFQPAILRHPSHDMAPREYRLNQDCLIFLIDNQDHFLVGMQGTAADEKTIQDVQSGAPPATSTSSISPSRANVQSLGRSSSNASAGAGSNRRYGNLRRNVSLSSKRSGHSAHTPSPGTPPPDSPYSAAMKVGGVHRSNTVPSKRQPSPSVAATQFQREKSSDQGESNVGMTTATVIAPIPTGTPSPRTRGAREMNTNAHETAAPVAIPAERMSPHLRPVQTSKTRTRSHDRQLNMDIPILSTGSVSPTGTPSRERTFSSFFNKSPASDAERRDMRRPNKLQKRRPDGGALNAQTSNASLSGTSYPPSPAPVSQSQELQQSQSGNNLEHTREVSGQTTDGYESAMEDLPPPVVSHRQQDMAGESQPQDTESSNALLIPGSASDAQLLAPEDTEKRASGTTLTPAKASKDSLTSHPSNGEQSPKASQVGQQAEAGEERQVSSESKESKDRDQALHPSPNASFSPPSEAEHSANSTGVHLSPPRKSLTDDSTLSTTQSGQQTISDSENGTHVSHGKGPIAWLKGKRQERKEKEAEKDRTKSPEKDRSRSAERRQSSHATSLSAAQE